MSPYACFLALVGRVTLPRRGLAPRPDLRVAEVAGVYVLFAVESTTPGRYNRAVLWYALYLAAHLLLYVAVLRTLPAFQRERTIFAYHALSVLVVLMAVGLELAVASGGPDFEWAVAIIAVHGIYSTSFLELWSLAEGGYSLQIMELLERAERRGERVDVEALRAIGAAKLGNRLAGLTDAGLVRRDGDRLTLTGFGRVVASCFALLAWLTNTKDGV